MYSGVKQAKSGIRILVVRLGAMGDIVHTLPALASLKYSFPGSRVTWVVEPQWAALLEQNPFLDRLVLLDRSNPAALFDSCRELRRQAYDIALDFQGLIKSALVASLARAERIFGFHQSQVRERLAALVYSNRTLSTGVHVVDKNLDLAVAAGASSVLRSFALPPGRAEGCLPEGNFVLASPLAGWRSKQWPLEYYARLGLRLQQELGIPLVLDGPPSARETLAAVPDVSVNSTEIAGLIYATRRAAAVVGVDSGPMHLAAALGRPGVAVFGPTDPGRNGPYGETFSVLRSPHAATSYKRLSSIDPSMREITPEMVFAALKALLIRRPSSAGCFA
jgi:lipopolysaccharide heptosyltransferase I